MKIAIASGKGGVGKSMLSSSLSILFSKKKNVVAVDCDADAPNLNIWLGESQKWEKIKKISVSKKPIIDNSKLTKKEALNCAEKCKFNALTVKKGKLSLNPFLCEGCGACEIFCPNGAIKMKKVKNGEIRTKNTKYNFPLISGQLFSGESGSGKVVTEIKKEADLFFEPLAKAKKFNAVEIIDSAPGTGCPVIASLRGVNFVILITEPTPSGFSDLKKVLKVVRHFNIPWGMIINKWDINKKLSHEMKKWAGKKFLGKISYDKEIFKAISNLTPIIETNLKAKKEITRIFIKICKKLW